MSLLFSVLRVPILLFGSTALLLATGCSESVESLEDVGGDSPGVVRVRVAEQDGDDHIPLTTIPKTVRIEMETGARPTRTFGSPTLASGSRYRSRRASA